MTPTDLPQSEKDRIKNAAESYTKLMNFPYRKYAKGDFIAGATAEHQRSAALIEAQREYIKWWEESGEFFESEKNFQRQHDFCAKIESLKNSTINPETK